MIYITKEEIMDNEKRTYILCDYSSIDKEYMDKILIHKQLLDMDYSDDNRKPFKYFRLNLNENYYVIDLDYIDNQDLVVM